MKLITRRIFFTLIIGGALGVAAGCGGGSNNAPATETGPRGRIVFAGFEPNDSSTNGGGADGKVSRSDIYLANADGSNRRSLISVTSGEIISDPVISPDGTRVAFIGAGPTASSSDIYTIAIDGTGLRRLTNDARSERSLGWTPDGKSLIYAGDFRDERPNPTFIYRVRTEVSSSGNSSAPQRLFNDDIERSAPTLAPDGRTLAFIADDDNGDLQIFVTTLDSSRAPRRVTSGELRGSIATFTPDSRRLVYVFLPPSNYANAQFNVINLDGTPAPGLPIDSYNAGGLAFSPDGKYIAYSGSSFDPSPGASNEGLKSKIFIKRADGKGEAKLLGDANSGVVEISPSWSR